MNRRTALRYMGAWGAAVTLSHQDPLLAAGVPGQELCAYNQLGYLPLGEKMASLPGDAAEQPFQIYSEVSGRSAFTGRLTTASVDAASGDRVALADFSLLTIPGAYRLGVQGIRTQPFLIRNDVYTPLLALTMRAFYGQRCGCAVDLGDGYHHAKCHTSGAYHVSSGRKGTLENLGGWHDAGDYGRYIVNSGITTGTLLWAWEMFPRVTRGLSLRIPESGGRLPDYLAEVRWNLQWMLSLQDEDGGVWHKQTSEQFCGFIMPEADTLTSYVIGTGTNPYKSTCATADLAAVMAIAARCYSAYDAAFSARCLAAARRAFAWSLAHPDVTFANPPGVGTGAYGDAHCNDEILWASAELWRSTGDPHYQQAFLAGTRALPPETAIVTPSWSNVAALAYWAYAMAERKGDRQMRDRILSQTAAAAQALVVRRSSNGYGNTMAASDYVWGSNAVATNQSLLLLVADRLQANTHFREAALGNLHYILGRNCFAVSWVTHAGTNPFLHPHHRPSIADSIPAPWPGLMSGGPNARPADKVAATLPQRPPMRMWIDDQLAYSMNEVAINWNAPLVFLLAAANGLG